MLRKEGIWVPWNGGKRGIPEDAVEGGLQDGTLYIAKANYNGNTLYGKYNPSWSEACFAKQDGKGHICLSNFEVSCDLTKAAFSTNIFNFRFLRTRVTAFYGDQKVELQLRIITFAGVQVVAGMVLKQLYQESLTMVNATLCMLEKWMN